MLEKLLRRRPLNAAAALVCALLMGFALYQQHIVGLDPCPLCVFQRIGVIAVGILFGVAALHHPRAWGSYVYAALLVAAAALGGAVAGRHVWLQSLPPEDVPACGPGLDYMLEMFPLGEMLEMVFSGSGECAEIVWSFLGLSMPAWVLVWFVILAVAGVAINSRRLVPD